MRILVTAGNTQTLLDRVRCITNIFTGRTGTRIALTAYERGHSVSLLTSHPRLVTELAGPPLPAGDRWDIRPYQTFEDLRDLMSEVIPGDDFDVIIHAAAVSDYHLGGAYVPAPGTTFDSDRQSWNSTSEGVQFEDARAGKMKSHHSELWLRLVPTPKLVDQIRGAWGFGGTLVKFKLEVGISESDLLDIAERSRQQSRADLMVANSLEEMHTAAYVGLCGGMYRRVERACLADHLLQLVENMQGLTQVANSSVPFPHCCLN